MSDPQSQAQYYSDDWSGDVVFVQNTAKQLVLASYEASSLTLEQYAEKVIRFADSMDEVKRREATTRRIMILRDAWWPLAKAYIESTLSPEVANLVLGINRDQMDISRNPAKRIWNELSVLYKAPPHRTTPKNKGAIDKYLNLFDVKKFNLWWQMVERLLNACREVVIWPEVITKADGTKIIKHRVEAGNAFTVITNPEDKTEIECFCHLYDFVDLDGNKHFRYQIWTNDWHAEFEKDTQGNIQRTDYIDPNLRPDEDDNSSNPYGEMPFVLVRLVEWIDSPWDISSGEDLVSLTINLGRERAMYRKKQRDAGVGKQGVVSGDFDHLPQQIMDACYLLKFPGQNVNFSEVDWTSPVKDALECMDMDEINAAAGYGINPQRYKQASNNQAGYQAKMADRGLIEHRDHTRPILGNAESQYFRKLCIVAKVHGIDDVPDPETELETNHYPLSYPESPRDQTELDKQQISMGTLSPLDLVKREHPSWTDDQCLEFIRKNLEVLAEVNDMKVQHNVPNDLANESRSAEANGALGPQVRDAVENVPLTPGGNGTAIPNVDRSSSDANG